MVNRVYFLVNATYSLHLNISIKKGPTKLQDLNKLCNGKKQINSHWHQYRPERQ